MKIIDLDNFTTTPTVYLKQKHKQKGKIDTNLYKNQMKQVRCCLSQQIYCSFQVWDFLLQQFESVNKKILYLNEKMLREKKTVSKYKDFLLTVPVAD